MKTNSLYKITALFSAVMTMFYFVTTDVSAETKIPVPIKSQVPGYYRMMLGDFEVTALYDGYTMIQNTSLQGINETDRNALFERMFIDSTNGVQVAVNAYLVNTKEHLILVDTGAAKCFGDTLGNIHDNIKAAGYTSEQIDTVLLTHLHPDHACGLSQGGKAAFPNATAYVAKGEADYWLSKTLTEKADAHTKPLFEMAQSSVAPYQANNRFKTYEDNLSMLTGVQIVPTNGHTPGHSAYLFTSNDQSLLLWGDIMHSYSIQFARPWVSLEYDSDAAAAIATRQKVLADAAKNKLWIGGAHLPFPGIGRVRADGKAYSWVPIEYAPIGK